MLLPRFLKSTSNIGAALSSLLLFNSVQGQTKTVANNTQGLTGFPPCDALIAANLSHAVHLPSSPIYTSLVNSYWVLNTRRAPYCFVLPSTPSEVSQTINALRSAGDGAGDWHIAIKSGGHGSDASNNIALGVTIDLSYLNTTTYDATTKVASVGTGARWGNVYDDLAKDGVLVTGGRNGVVGVGGFTLGGGNSFYTARNGFACDTVVNYEVVLASGEVINANASANSDLWSALKGGSSNFGIVTRFDLEAFPAMNLSYGTRTIGIEHSDEVVDAFVNFTNLDQSFADNAMLTGVSYSPASGFAFSITEANTMDDAKSTAFDEFNGIPALTPFTMQSLSLSEVAILTSVGEGARSAGTYLTLANDPQVLRYCFEQHAVLAADLNATLGTQNFTTLLEVQPLPSYFADISVQKGGNMLGLERESRNRMLFVGGVTLTGNNSEAQLPLASQKVYAMVERIEAFAESVGSSDGFVYLNYAHASQDPLGSYGSANVERIKQVAHKYDPNGFFQKRVPGGFKIDRVD